MQFATLFDAFGVSSLDREETTPTKRTKFKEEVFGHDVTSEKDRDEEVAIIPEERKITKREVKEFITKVYRKDGMNAVWSVLDHRIKKKLLGMCNKTASNVQNFFDDFFTSPEKLLSVLAVLFVLIILLDISGNKKSAEPTCFPPQFQMPQNFQLPQQFQMYQMPQQHFSNPINLQ